MQNQVYPERRKVPTQRIGTQAISGWPIRPLPNLITFNENYPATSKRGFMRIVLTQQLYKIILLFQNSVISVIFVIFVIYVIFVTVTNIFFLLSHPYVLKS